LGETAEINGFRREKFGFIVFRILRLLLPLWLYRLANPGKQHNAIQDFQKQIAAARNLSSGGQGGCWKIGEASRGKTARPSPASIGLLCDARLSAIRETGADRRFRRISPAGPFRADSYARRERRREDRLDRPGMQGRARANLVHRRRAPTYRTTDSFDFARDPFFLLGARSGLAAGDECWRSASSAIFRAISQCRSA